MNNFLLEPYNGEALTYDNLLELAPSFGSDTGVDGEEVAANFNCIVDSALEIVYLEDSVWQFKDIERAQEYLAVAGWGNPNMNSSEVR